MDTKYILPVAAFVGSTIIDVMLVPVAFKAWRYRGDNVSDVMIHTGFSEKDKLHFSRGVLPSAVGFTAISFLIGVNLLRELILVVGGADWNIDPLNAFLVGLIALGGLFTFLTVNLHWPQFLIPPAFRGGHPKWWRRRGHQDHGDVA